MKTLHSDEIRRRTANLFGALFPLTTTDGFRRFQGVISPNIFHEPSAFLQHKRVLELGCGGMGATIAGFLGHGAREVVGIDLSAHNIQALKKRFGNNTKVKFYIGDICNLPSGLGMFDIIYSGGVIHHVINPERAIQEAYRVLKPGGTIIVYVYGSGGIITNSFKALRHIQRFLPLEKFLKLTRHISKSFSFFLGDYLYVPIQHHYTEQEAKNLFFTAGFSSVERLPNTQVISNWMKYLLPSQLNYQSTWSHIMFGTGGITLKAKK